MQINNQRLPSGRMSPPAHRTDTAAVNGWPGSWPGPPRASGQLALRGCGAGGGLTSSRVAVPTAAAAAALSLVMRALAAWVAVCTPRHAPYYPNMPCRSPGLFAGVGVAQTKSQGTIVGMAHDHSKGGGQRKGAPTFKRTCFDVPSPANGPYSSLHHLSQPIRHRHRSAQLRQGTPTDDRFYRHPATPEA